MKRKFKEFLEETSSESVKKVALEYATSTDDVTINFLSDKYNLSEGAVKSCIQYSITHCLVSYNIAMSMKEKAHRNQSRHTEKESFCTSSDKKYERFFVERRYFIRKNLSDEYVRNVVNKYVANPHISALGIAESFGLSIAELNAVLEKAIVFNIVDSNTSNQLFSISIKKSSNVRATKTFFKKIAYSRTLFRNLNDEIAQLHYQLETYEHFVSSDQDLEYSKGALEEKLKAANVALDEFKERFYNA